METEKKPTYAEAIAEIEAILAKMNAQDANIDALASQVKRATELIALCKERLQKTEKDVNKILDKE